MKEEAREDNGDGNGMDGDDSRHSEPAAQPQARVVT